LADRDARIADLQRVVTALGGAPEGSGDVVPASVPQEQS
jgi:hypothetical protein